MSRTKGAKNRSTIVKMAKELSECVPMRAEKILALIKSDKLWSEIIEIARRNGDGLLMLKTLTWLYEHAYGKAPSHVTIDVSHHDAGDVERAREIVRELSLAIIASRSLPPPTLANANVIEASVDVSASDADSEPNDTI